MKIELHILQNFAPANLNRDDTGAPKDCDFGGVRRARISSQCLKRAIRTRFQTGGHFDQVELGARTKRLVDQVARELTEHHGVPDEHARRLVQVAIEGAGLGVTDERKTQYLLFLPRRLIRELASFVAEERDMLEPLIGGNEPQDGESNGKKKTKSKKGKAASFPKELAAKLADIVSNARKTPDLALFGRMIADKPEWNLDAACQVSHALSTNRVSMDFDFYTAVDDFRPDDTAGSDMMGTVQFNSSCFYRYSVLDLAGLEANLDADSELLRRTVDGYLRASVEAVPTGKQNSTAAQNPPSYVLAVARGGGMPVSLANAFLRPVRPDGVSDLMSASIIALEDYFGNVSRMYGASDVQGAVAVADRELAAPPKATAIERAGSVDDAIGRTLEAATSSRKEA